MPVLGLEPTTFQSKSKSNSLSIRRRLKCALACINSKTTAYNFSTGINTEFHDSIMECTLIRNATETDDTPQTIKINNEICHAHGVD